MITPEKIFSKFTDILSGNYNVESDVYINEQKISLYACSKLEMQHYALSKKIVLDKIQINDFLFCWSQQSELTLYQFEKYCRWLTEQVAIKGSECKQHMRSRFVGIIFIEGDLPDRKVLQRIKKFHKFYPLKWGLNGWYEFFFILFFIQSTSWIFPRQGKDFKPMLEKLRLKLVKY